MDSKTLNEKIAEICDDDTHYEAFGGKSIPYIGWFWRRVNFDRKDYAFGVLPGGELAFMENNKWGYLRQYCEPEDWVLIKQLLVEAVTDPCRDTLQAVDDKIQSLR